MPDVSDYEIQCLQAKQDSEAWRSIHQTLAVGWSSLEPRFRELPPNDELKADWLKDAALLVGRMLEIPANRESIQRWANLRFDQMAVSLGDDIARHALFPLENRAILLEHDALPLEILRQLQPPDGPELDDLELTELPKPAEASEWVGRIREALAGTDGEASLLRSDDWWIVLECYKRLIPTGDRFDLRLEGFERTLFDGNNAAKYLVYQGISPKSVHMSLTAIWHEAKARDSATNGEVNKQTFRPVKQDGHKERITASGPIAEYFDWALAISDDLNLAVQKIRPDDPRRYEAIQSIEPNKLTLVQSEAIAEAKRLGELAVLAPKIDAIRIGLDQMMSAAVRSSFYSEEWALAYGTLNDSLNAMMPYLPLQATAGETRETNSSGPPAKGQEKWRKAQRRMMELFQQDKLPKTVRQAAKLLKSENYTYNTVLTAAHNSVTLRSHFDLQDSDAKREGTSGNLLDELAEQSDKKTADYLEKLSPDQRYKAQEHLKGMSREEQLNLVGTLALNPDAGSTGDCYLDAAEADPNDEGYVAKGGRRRKKRTGEWD